MPINPGGQGLSYNRQTISASVPARSGVYALCNAQQWIYVGETGDIQARLIQHLNGDNACITRSAPTVFQFDLVDANQRVAVQDRWIAQLGTMTPAGCNQRFG